MSDENEQPQPPAGIHILIEMHTASREMRVTGAIDDPILFLGMMEQAKEIVAENRRKLRAASLFDRKAAGRKQ